MVRQPDCPSSLPVSAFRPSRPSIRVFAMGVSLPLRRGGWLRYVRRVQRLLRFVLGVAAVIAALEVAFRLGEPAIGASGHRVLTKAALLDAQGPVEVLFF